MAMPAPGSSDPRWSFEMAGGAMMDLGCYGLHVMRRLGHPSIIRAHAKERAAGVDEWCDVELGFPSGATGMSANTMAAPDHSFTLRIVGTKGDVLVHNFIKPHEDDRLTIRTPAGTKVEHHGTRTSYSYQLEAFAAHVLYGAPLPIDDGRRSGEHGLRRCRIQSGGDGPALNRPRYSDTESGSGARSRMAETISRSAAAASSGGVSKRAATNPSGRTNSAPSEGNCVMFAQA